MNERRFPLAAAALATCGTLHFACMDASSKYLVAFLPVVLIIWVRFTLQACLMGAWLAARRGMTGFRSQSPRLQMLRGILLTASTITTVYTLRHMPLAEFTAIIMLSPVVVTALAARLLRERVGLLRWLLVLGGFAGTLLVIRPGSGLFGPVAWLPVLCMVLISAYNLLTGRLAALDAPETTQFFTGVTGSLLLFPVVLVQSGALIDGLLQQPLLHWMLLLLIGWLGTVGHLLLVIAFAHAGTSAVMPFTYAQIGFAALVGWVVFGHLPDGLAWTGMALIAACGAAAVFMNARPRS